LKTILVTGGAGFMGSNFVRYLYDHHPDYRLVVLDVLTYAGNLANIPEHIKKDPRFSFWYGSIRNSQLVDELVSQSDVVVHIAAESHVARSIFDNALCYDTNVMGTQVVANAVLKFRKRVERFIHCSSAEVYGTAETAPMDEAHPLNSLTPYASAKAGADRLVYSYWTTYEIPAIIIRPFNNYGPQQHLEKVTPRFITSAILSEPLTVHGDGSYTRDWVFVEDFCEGMDRAISANLDSVKGQVINLGTGKEVSILDIARRVLELVPESKSKIVHQPNRPGQVKRHISATEKAGRLLDWRSRTSFPEGLGKTIGWYRTNRAWWEPMLWMRQIAIVTEDAGKDLY